jgi:dolichyl-phosphate-mannose-protein mannosyltransferase
MLRHVGSSGGYLHSHNYKYPDGSKQQQITCHSAKGFYNLIVDADSVFIIHDQFHYEEDPLKVNKPFVHLENKMVIRLFHRSTKRYLHSHDIRPSNTFRILIIGFDSDKVLEA